MPKPMPITQQPRPDDIFRNLKSWWELHEGFGVAFVFSVDLVSMQWLGQRIEEDLQTLSRSTVGLHFAKHVEEQTQDFFRVLALPERHLHWIFLQKKHLHSWLKMLNESRQALIGSGHLFVLWVQQTDVDEVDALAPDLWSVRSWVHFAAPKAGRADFERIFVSDRAMNRKDHWTVQQNPLLPATIDQWQRSYAAWQSSPVPERKRLSPGLARQAAADAEQMRDFERAKELLNQSAAVALQQAQAIEQAHALLSLGKLQHRLGAVDEARALYVQAIALYEKEQDSTGLARARAGLAAMVSREPLNNSR